MPPASTLLCPRCGAARVAAPECPRCGVIYAKARPWAAAASIAEPPAPSSPELSQSVPLELARRTPDVWAVALDEARGELLARALAPPVALAIAWLLVSSPGGPMLVRTLLSMW